MKIITKHKEWNRKFVLRENPDGYMMYLGNKDDLKEMNWIEGENLWGEVLCPESLEVRITREYTYEGNLRETYVFKNITEFPVFIKKTDIGIYTTFNDNYQEAEKCLDYKCHTHIFCGDNAAYIMALRMSGKGSHLGLKLVQGNIHTYSIERDKTQRSDDRGDFILHPAIEKINPGEIIMIQWELFWFDSKDAFYNELLATPYFPVVLMNQSTYFIGEEIFFRVGIRAEDEITAYVSLDDKTVPFKLYKEQNITWLVVSYLAEREGEYRFEFEAAGKKSFAVFYCCPSLNIMTARRCKFLIERQQLQDKNSPLDGAYLIYDREEHCQYYNHTSDDHNGGRERLSMGALVALWLQIQPDKLYEKSLRQYTDFIYRELYKTGEGIVYNDINYNLEWNRMYNYPWMAIFLIEIYRLWGKRKYLLDAYFIMKKYYDNGGTEFYAIGIPACELRNELINAGFTEEAADIEKYAVTHAERILQNSVYYPTSEVSYEQGTVASAVGCLLQGYQISGNSLFLREAEKQLDILAQFNGRQPDFHLFENAIRHWDGYWFGKRRMFGDTFPHYWSCLTGVEYGRYAEIIKDKHYLELACSSLRGCLNLFFPDGFASCAMVFPEYVNGEKAHYYDPWANDQDWALYYALKYRVVTENSSIV